MKTADSLKRVLQSQLAGYKVLVDLLRRERAALAAFDRQAVEDLSKEKDTLALKLRLLEEERLRLINKLARETDKGEQALRGVSATMSREPMTLLQVAVITGDEEFRELRSSFKSLVQVVGELNEFNRFLIDRSLQYIRLNTAFFQAHGITGKGTAAGVSIAKEA
ncbi:MAG: flagellar protein FlgN [Nitrospirae bacterium]|nr:flagellar protein FlgN [Nitrospirota bacterium]